MRANVESLHSSYSTITTQHDLISHQTHQSQQTQSISTLHDSSLGISPSGSMENQEYTGPTEFTFDQCRVIGRIDYERCISDILPKYSRSQCVTQATRLFDEIAVERYVSKTVDGPCCHLYVMNLEEFAQSLSQLPDGMNLKKSSGRRHKCFIILESDLKSCIISEMKYNIPFVERIVEYDESSTVCSF